MKFTSTLLIAITAIASINGLAIDRRDPGHSDGKPAAEGEKTPAANIEEAPSSGGGDLLGGLLGGILGGGGGSGGLLGGLLGGGGGSGSEGGSGGMLSSIPIAGGLLSGFGLGI